MRFRSFTGSFGPPRRPASCSSMTSTKMEPFLTGSPARVKVYSVVGTNALDNVCSERCAACKVLCREQCNKRESGERDDWTSEWMYCKGRNYDYPQEKRVGRLEFEKMSEELEKGCTRTRCWMHRTSQSTLRGSERIIHREIEVENFRR